MYFPFLRGKQFELIALREEAPLIGDSGKIIPVIEPIKESGSYKKTLEAFDEYNIQYCLIINPRVSDSPLQAEEAISFFNQFDKKGRPIYTFIIDNLTNIEKLTSFIYKHLTEEKIAFIYKNLPEDDQLLSEMIDNISCTYNFISEGYSKRYIRQIRKRYSGDNRNLILLADHFPKQDRNSDYPKAPVFFSDDHAFYQEENFIGFSDYLTIGENYSELGFAPRAVTFHLTFTKDNELWIKHFVSDTIDNDPSKVGQKSDEALKKAKAFIQEKHLNTSATNEIIEISDEGRFPGLGYLKKLSIKHHIELVNQLME